MEGKYPDEDDMFDYWADLEYLSDGGYHDNKDPDAKSKKRKVASGDSPQATRKRRKTKSTDERAPVLWMTRQERDAAAAPRSLGKAGKLKSIGLLRDWETKTKGQRGLAEFPEGDFQLQDKPQEGDEWESDQEVEGEGFDLGNLQDIAGMLSGEHMEALQKMMEAKGLDPEAVQEVLKDMLEGRERDIVGDEAEDEEGQKEEEQAEADKEELKEHGKISMNPAPTTRTSRRAPSQTQVGSSSGTQPASSSQPNGRSPHGKKRKAVEDNHSAAVDEVPKPSVAAKRRKSSGPHAAQPPEQPTRSSGRKR